MRVVSVLMILNLAIFAAADIATVTIWVGDDITNAYVQKKIITQGLFLFDAMFAMQKSSNPYFTFEYEVDFTAPEPARNITSLCGLANGK